ncbi:MAG: PAS domain-containing protein [Pseudomonadota bacterium]
MRISSAARQISEQPPEEQRERVPMRTSAQLLPDWHGRYRARRVRGKSQPAIIRGLLAMAIVGILACCVVLAYALYVELQEKNRLQAVAVNERAAAQMSILLNDGLYTIEEVSDGIRRLGGVGEVSDPGVSRALRRTIVETITGSPVSSAYVIGPQGNIVLDASLSNVGFERAAAMPIDFDAAQIDRPFEVLPIDGGRVLRVSSPGPESGYRIVGVIEAYALINALAPETGIGFSTVLLDRVDRPLMIVSDGEIVAAGAPGASILADQLTTAARAPVQADNLSVQTIPKPITAGQVLSAFGLILLCGVGVAMLFVGIFVYVLQNEWTKHDRRAALDEDAVARSEIAADMMNVGIIDWRVSDAAVFYSEGWQNLFASRGPAADQEIFDWLDRIHPNGRGAVRDTYTALLEGEVFEIDHEIQVRRTRGDYIWVRERGRARLDANGKPRRIILLQRPVRKRDGSGASNKPKPSIRAVT